MKTKVVNKNSFTQELSVTVPWKNLKEDYQKACRMIETDEYFLKLYKQGLFNDKS